MADDLSQLERLERLRASGALNDTEFSREKRRILAASEGPIKPDWRFVIRTVALFAIAGAIAVAVLLLMPPPERATPGATAAMPPNGPDRASVAEPDPPARDDDSAPIPEGEQDGNAATSVPATSPEEGYVEKPPVKGRCQLQVKGTDYINGPCDIVMSSDGSFDVQDHFGNPRYFGKVLRDGASAHGFWNGAPGSTHAQDDLGDLTRQGACWVNEQARICAWS